MNHDAFNSRSPAEAADFPAAHSMDTDWFAIDEVGHVALLSSGEDGAVPRDVKSQEAGISFFEAFAKCGGKQLWTKGVRGAHISDMPEAWEQIEFSYSVYSVLMYLRSTSTFDPQTAPDSLDRESTRLSPHREDVYSDLWRGASFIDEASGEQVTPCQFSYLSREFYNRLHAAGACGGCYAFDNPINAGLFRFDCDNYGVPPYKRLASPKRPLTLDELPTEVRAVAERVRLPGAHFATQEQLQPLEHVECNTWGAHEYVGTDGERHPIPGAEPPPPAPPPPVQEPVQKPRRRWRWWPF